MNPEMCVCGHPQSGHQTGRGGLNLTGDQVYGLCLDSTCQCTNYRDAGELKRDLQVASAAALTPYPPGSHVLLVERSSLPEVQVGDHITVSAAEEAPDGRIVVARNEAGEYTLARCPVGEGLTVEGVVVGLSRRLA